MDLEEDDDGGEEDASQTRVTQHNTVTPPAVLLASKDTADSADRVQSDRARKFARTTASEDPMAFANAMMSRTLDAVSFVEANGMYPAVKTAKDLAMEEKAQPADLARKTRLVDVTVDVSQPAVAPDGSPVKVYMWDNDTFLIRGSAEMARLRSAPSNVQVVEAGTWETPGDRVMKGITKALNDNFGLNMTLPERTPLDDVSAAIGLATKAYNTLKVQLEETREKLKARNQRVAQLKLQLSAATDAAKEAVSTVTAADRKAIELAAAEKYKKKANELQKAADAYINEAADKKAASARVQQDALIRNMTAASETMKERLLLTAKLINFAPKGKEEVEKPAEACLTAIERFLSGVVRAPFASLGIVEALQKKNTLAIRMLKFTAGLEPEKTEELNRVQLLGALERCVPTFNEVIKESSATANATLELVGESDQELNAMLQRTPVAPTDLLSRCRLSQAVCQKMKERLAGLTGRVPNSGTFHLNLVEDMVTYFGMGSRTARIPSVLSTSKNTFGPELREWFRNVYSSLLMNTVQMGDINTANRFVQLSDDEKLSFGEASRVLTAAQPCLQRLGRTLVLPMITAADAAVASKADLESKLQTAQSKVQTAEVNLAAVKTESATQIQTLTDTKNALAQCLTNVSVVPRVKDKLDSVYNGTLNVDTLPKAVTEVGVDTDKFAKDLEAAALEKNNLELKVKAAEVEAQTNLDLLSTERTETKQSKAEVERLKKQTTLAATLIQNLKEEVQTLKLAKGAVTADTAQPAAKVIPPELSVEVAQPEVEYKTLESQEDEAEWEMIKNDPRKHIFFVVAKHRKKPKGWSRRDIFLLAERIGWAPDTLVNVLEPPKAQARRNTLGTRTASGGGGDEPPGGGGLGGLTGEEEPDPSFESKIFKLPPPKTVYTGGGGGGPPSDPPGPGGFGGTVPRERDATDPEVQVIYNTAGGAPPPPPPPPGGATTTTLPKKAKGKGSAPSDPIKDSDPIDYPSKPKAGEVKDATSDLLWRVRFLQTLVVKERAMVRLVVGRLHRALTSVLSLTAHVCPQITLLIPNHSHALTIHAAVKQAWPDVPEPQKDAFPEVTRGSAPVLYDAWTPRKPPSSAKVETEEISATDEAPNPEALLKTLDTEKTTLATKLKTTTATRSQAMLTAAKKNDATMSKYAEYVDSVMESSVKTGKVDWCSLLSMVEADSLNSQTAVYAVLKQLDESTEEAQKLRLSMTLANDNTQQLALTVTRFGVYYTAKLAKEVAGVQELELEGTLQAMQFVKDLAAHMADPSTAPGTLREHLLQTTVRLLGVLSLGRSECHDAIRLLYNQSPSRTGAGIPVPIVLDQNTMNILTARAPTAVHSNLLHWGAVRSEAAGWARRFPAWVMGPLADFMTLPQELYPSVIELMHWRIGAAYTNPRGLAMELPESGRSLFASAVGAATFEDCPFLGTRPNGFGLLDINTNRYALPFDCHTLVVTGLPTFSAAVQALDALIQFRLRDCVIDQGRLELVFVDGTGRIVRPSDAVADRFDRLYQKSGSSALKMSFILSQARSHADYLVRLRWLRATRMLREFDILSQADLPTSRQILVSVLNEANTADVLLDHPVLELPTQNKNIHGYGAVLDARLAPQNVFKQLATDTSALKGRALALRNMPQ